MNNKLITTKTDFYNLITKLHKEKNIYFTLNKLTNRLSLQTKDTKEDKELESIVAYFTEHHSVELNPNLIITYLRGYYYNNLSTLEENKNTIKDDFYYSILNFVKDKTEIKMNDICLHLFNLNHNKVKQDIKSHISRCLVEIGFEHKRTNQGITWKKVIDNTVIDEISTEQGTQATLISESIDMQALQEKRETTLEATPRIHRLHETDNTVTDEINNNEINELKKLLEEEKNKNIKLEKEIIKKDKLIEEIKLDVEKYQNLFIQVKQDNMVLQKELKEYKPEELVSSCLQESPF